MRNWIFFLVATLLLVLPAGAARDPAPQDGPRVTAQLATGVVKLGGVVNCVVQVEGARSATLEGIPTIEGLRLERRSGPSVSESRSLVGGRLSYSRTVSWVITFRPGKLGDYTIPPMRLAVDGKAMFTRELTLSVVEDMVGQELGHLEFVDVPEQIYEGQPFSVRMMLGWDLKLDQRVNVANLILPWWNELPGTLEVEAGAATLNARYVEITVNSRSRIRAVDLGEQEVSGKQMRLLSLTRTFVATRAGQLDFPQSWLEFGHIQRRAFSEERETYHVGVPAFSVEVRELPEKGRPFEYSGGVGRFSVEADVNRRDVDVGESIKLTVDWTGDANLEFFDLPDPSRMEAFESFRVYGTTNERFYGDRRRVVYDLAPLTSEVYEIPALPLVIFDPELGEYRTVASKPIPIRVRALQGATGLSDEDRGEAVLFAHDIQTRPEPDSDGGGPGSALLFGAWLGLPAMWLVSRTVVRRRGDPDAPAARRRRAARKALHRNLRGANTARDQAWSLYEFLGARSGELPEAWEGRDVKGWIEEVELELDAEASGELIELCRELDQRRWAGEDEPVARERVTAIAERLLKEGF